MKTIIIIFSIFLAQNCNNKATQLQLQEKLPSAIESVYFQRWIGGRQETGSGINFHIQFKTALPNGVQLKKVYFQNNEADFEEKDPTTFVAYFKFKPKSEIILDSDPKKEYGNKTPETNKLNSDLQPNEAILEFVKNEKVIKVKIQNIKEKELIAYPSARPRN
ncbi:hypothetical protein [Flavobacterium sp.]|uniref:hypothetical protein n=1 Tax=Flavobacterium sp. TaxID=239 RepID=UPI00286E5FB5|nr:hypothetical protein [Flavobacterium sp.]